MISSFAEAHKLPSYRVDQFNKHFYQEAALSFDDFTTWPKELREKAQQIISFSTIEPVDTVVSSVENTMKVLFRRKKDGKHFESVLMQFEDGRNTVCVSCMIGCPVGCAFCATGKLGFSGNLSAREIVDQVLYFKRFLKQTNRTISNIVFMGMGEPLLNLDAVLAAIDVMTAPEKLAFSGRRITISTCGYISGLKKLLQSGFTGRLAVSLHAPTQKLRESLVPIAKKNPLGELFSLLDRYVQKTNKRITYEYVLLSGINDSPHHARAVARLLSNRLAHVNLIPYNEVPGTSYVTPDRETIDQFAKVLSDSNISNTVRVSMGADVAAACGQLAGQSI